MMTTIDGMDGPSQVPTSEHVFRTSTCPISIESNMAGPQARISIEARVLGADTAAEASGGCSIEPGSMELTDGSH
jgi:hypothetical protein